MIFPSATVDVTRAGATVYWSRRVQLEFLSLHERTMAAGIFYDARIFDEAGSDWKIGDIVDVRSVDGSMEPLNETKFRVNLVLREPGPLEVVEAALVGGVS